MVNQTSIYQYINGIHQLFGYYILQNTLFCINYDTIFLFVWTINHPLTRSYDIFIRLHNILWCNWFSLMRLLAKLRIFFFFSFLLRPQLLSWQTGKSIQISSGQSRQTTLWTLLWWSFSTFTTGAEWEPWPRMSSAFLRYVEENNLPSIWMYLESWLWLSLQTKMLSIFVESRSYVLCPYSEWLN